MKKIILLVSNKHAPIKKKHIQSRSGALLNEVNYEVVKIQK